jgi:methionyl-tRNA formyltransferase
MNNKIDSGNILLKKSLSLHGTLDEIFQRMIKNDYEMIIKIIKGNYKIQKQKGHPTYYKRRKPEQSELSLNKSKEYIYNFIRMLSDPYPNAFTKIGEHKIIFKSAKLENNKLYINGEIE